MYRNFKFLLKLTKPQHAAFRDALETQRRLYNSSLEERKLAYENGKASVTLYDQTASLTAKRRINSWLAKVPVNLSRHTLRRLDLAFSSFYRRIKAGQKPGYPRFKGRMDSFGFNEFSGLKLVGDGISFKGVPGRVRINAHRDVPSKDSIKGCVFRRYGRRWFVIFQAKVPSVEPVDIKSAIGIDVGLRTLVALSSGELIENIRTTKLYEKELRRRGRSFSRCQKGSVRGQKVRLRLSKIHEKIANTRNTYLHSVSSDLVKRFDFIALENLDIKGMASGRLAKFVHDAAWHKLRQMLIYKAENAGKSVVMVDPRWTSQVCSGCGSVVPKDLSVTTHSCPKCGSKLDRDVNAARNILNRAVASPGQLNVANCCERAAGIAF